MPLPLTALLASLGIGSWANALYFLGVGAAPAGEGASDPGKTVGWISFLTGFGIGITGLWMVFTSPEGMGPVLSISVGGLAVAFAFVWIVLGIVQIQGLDLRPLGNISIWVGIYTLMFIPIFAGGTPVGVNLTLFWTIMVVWAIGLFMIPLVAYGRLSAKVLGWWLVVFAIWTTLVPAYYINLEIALF